VTPDKDPGSEAQTTGFRALIDRRDADMTSTYVQVMVLEAVIIVALWVFGRIFS
jgi:hypothetical protein